jgi:hypothetical protein
MKIDRCCPGPSLEEAKRLATKAFGFRFVSISSTNSSTYSAQQQLTVPSSTSHWTSPVVWATLSSPKPALLALAGESGVSLSAISMPAFASGLERRMLRHCDTCSRRPCQYTAWTQAQCCVHHHVNTPCLTANSIVLCSMFRWLSC